MTAPRWGLPDGQRRQVAGLLDRALTAIGDGSQSISTEHSGRVTWELLCDVHQLGDMGLFELAAACAVTIGGEPGTPDQPLGNLRYLGFGSDERTAQPGTPADYRRSAFVTAILAGDRARAWAVFAPLLAESGEQPSPGLLEFLSVLVRNAWSRHAGGKVLLRVPPTDDWPPACDFCCTPGASAWLWHCKPADVSLISDGQQVDIRFTDAEFWYGCHGCRPLVAVAKPDWRPVWHRHRAQRPNANRGAVVSMFLLFAQHREQVEPVPLPATRPQPTRF